MPMSDRQASLLAALAPQLESIGGRPSPDDVALQGDTGIRLVFSMPDGAPLEIDFSFVPDMSGEQRYENLQAHAFVHNDFDVGAITELLWLVAQVNRYLPTGSFGVLEDLEMLYWKQNIFVSREVDAAVTAAIITQQMGVAVRAISDYWDTMQQVASGDLDALSALRANKWGPVLFGL
jgi:hypothetical protein